MSLATLRRTALCACAALVTVLPFAQSLSAQNAAPAAAPTYDAVFDMSGNVYSGTTTFVVDKAGKVSGTMKLTSPALVSAELNGEIKDGVWTFSYEFTMDMQGQVCGGTTSGTAKVAADRSEVSGSLETVSNCTADAVSGTFSFKKQANK